ncbi:DVU3141 family protein [Aquibaculum arenosum]|uniref:Surface antigen domain-containing protein n=1 Tax=Aquibaculum arenosum TaxID=3032591 RepID=A0ABT5YJX2_9PROT|nr:DVU3141 family protein [Fodinicurvata sp. CAU 1616]MDF2095189.1 hypothetical protein [Fodinicurvata sp. CAU 1616]
MHLTMKLLGGLSLCLLVAACSTVNSATPEGAPTAGGIPVAVEQQTTTPADAALLNFASTAPPGSQELIPLEGGVEAQVLINEEYVSARGRLCRRLTLWNTQTARPSERVMCQGQQGWHLIRPLRELASR